MNKLTKLKNTTEKNLLILGIYLFLLPLFLNINDVINSGTIEILKIIFLNSILFLFISIFVYSEEIYNKINFLKLLIAFFDRNNSKLYSYKKW